jgi:hypothetical protein
MALLRVANRSAANIIALFLFVALILEPDLYFPLVEKQHAVVLFIIAFRSTAFLL